MHRKQATRVLWTVVLYHSIVSLHVCKEYVTAVKLKTLFLVQIKVDWGTLNVPPNTLYVISGTGFYGSNDPTNSVKALKDDRSKGLGFNPIRSTPPCSHWYNNYAVWNIKTQIHTNTDKSTNSEMGPVWQNPIQRTVRTAHLSVLTTVCNFSTQYNTEQFW